MHNCKTTESRLIDLALDQAQAKTNPQAVAAVSDRSAQVLAELAGCSECRAEYAALRRTLKVVDQAAQGAIPSETFWTGYNSRLSERLKTATGSTAAAAQPRTIVSLWSTLRKIAGASVRIPVPIAAALLLFFGLSLFFLVHARDQAKQVSLPAVAVAETKTVEVPVIREKVVTRVVYLAANRRPGAAHTQPNRTENLSTAAARLGKEPAGSAAGNLSGFKPTDQVRLTIIKGSYHDEK